MNNEEERLKKSKTHATTIGRKRDRVRGPGPNRKDLPNFKILTKMPQEVIEDLLNLYNDYSGVNFLHSDEYEIKNCCNLQYAISKDFQHILLQDFDPDSDEKTFMEMRYLKWNEYISKYPRAKEWIDSAFPNAFRTRISVLKPGDSFGWHIDTNTSVACRVTCVLNNADSTFEVDRKGVIERMEAEVGDCVFTNIGYPHRVHNETEDYRINLLFAIEYKDIAQYFEE